jgi:hypothetical protein
MPKITVGLIEPVVVNVLVCPRFDELNTKISEKINVND